MQNACFHKYCARAQLSAAMITMTPGTLSADIAPDRRWLLVHAFNVDDEAALIGDIQQRYERPLREIFT